MQRRAADLTEFPAASPGCAVRSEGQFWPSRFDPRIPFAALLALYCALGWTVLGFNRNPLQVCVMVGACLFFEVLFHRLLRGGWLFPLSALISGLGLSLLLNFSHDPWLPLLPAFACIASKYLLTYDGKHLFNPGLFGVLVAIKLGHGLYATAPAYQWGSGTVMSMVIIVGALIFFIRRVGRLPLVIAFAGFYLLQTLARVWLMRYHLPAETVFAASLLTPSFFLFTFYMITDPKTSPAGVQDQILWALALTILDLYFHLKTSLATFFLALFVLSAARGIYLHLRRLGHPAGLPAHLRRWALRLAALGSLGGAGLGAYAAWIHPRVMLHPSFRFEPVAESQSGLHAELSRVLETVDPRVRHIAKWVMSVGDAAAVADYDGDGLPDLFLTNPLKRAEDRNALYHNLGGFRFERVALPALDEVSRHPERYGLVSGAIFFDYDNSGAPSLLLLSSFGRSLLLKNQRRADGTREFVDVTGESGLNEYTISLAAAVFDYDRDGWPDLLIGNALSPELPDYARPTPLNLFHLPPAEYPGDRRPFHFLHEAWHNSTNGGLNVLYHNDHGRFVKQDIRAMGMPETHWTLAIGTDDFNGDGWPDLYCASDFGPDDVYLNDHGRRFIRVAGPLFGDIGRDTYKGMNVSIGDLNNSGEDDVYVSNVHAPLQAEGSLLWHASADPRNPFNPRFSDTAAARGVVNESRFGWGAAMGDLDLDGWLDLVQANGHIDDSADRRFDTPRDYWYYAGYMMRAGPEVHSYADRWPDLRGYEIWGHQKDRVYLNRGADARPQFVDAAESVGITRPGNSRAMVLADFDNDGAPDLLITHMYRPADLYRNTRLDAAHAAVPGRPHWLGLALRGDGMRVTRDALGARVRVTAEVNGRKLTQSREVRAGSGFSAQGDMRLLFGLGAVQGPVRVEILWPDGLTEQFTVKVLDRYSAVVYGEAGSASGSSLQ